jgi:haloalkane dehalogenase
MQQIFIELYSYRASWHALPAGERRRFADLILADAQGLTEHGVEVVGWGMSDPDTDRRAPWDFFCVYRVPSAEFQRAFEAKINSSKWYEYFEQVNVSGASLSPSALLDANVKLRKPEAQKTGG